MYVLGIDHVMDMPFNDPQSPPIALKYGDVFKQTEEEYARWNFDVANTEVLLRHFEEAEAECAAILAQEHIDPPKTGKRIIMPIRPMTSASRPRISSTCSMRAGGSFP